ncbi:YkvA family protein [Nonomuraea typhae]|uniref:YkvA family protein n=1 Tax=Nonomuraea typhae TaxID=2603600 RepID=A0ABW7YXJ2_9ACTN
MKRIGAIPRMIRAGMRGDYPGMGRGKIALMALGLVYLISPIDLIPEFLLLIGVADDFGVLLWLAGSLVGESGRYLDRERKVIAGTTVPPA